MKHEYSTYALLILGCVLFVSILTAIDSGDMDLLCNNDGSMLVRKNGAWICTTNANLEEDLRMPSNVLAVRGANTPTWTAYNNGLEALAFSPTIMKEVWSNTQMPHGRKENTTLGLHFHWMPATTNVGGVVWCVEYACANIEVEMPASTTSCVVQSSDGVALKHKYSPSVNVTNTLKYSAICDFRLYRNATDSRDTFTGNAYLAQFDVHYVALSIGEDV
jgi:hypothetical protein